MEEKKESWIETLIELLNEYEIWKWKNGLDIRQQYSEHNFKYNKWLYNIVISKKYWFIQWLVDNDKIDFDTIPNKIKEIWMPILIQWEIQYWFDSSDLDWLLMALSIQDEPIQFLISILK